ncbi:hypothetical protein AAMO2058_000797500 [Amorphochlora amoebiformis]
MSVSWAGEKEFKGLLANLNSKSSSKINGIAKFAVKHAKHYKMVVHFLEKHIKRCKPRLKLYALYVMDSICRHSRAKYGEKDPYVGRFARKLEGTFQSLVECPEEDLDSMARVVGVWTSRKIFPPAVITPVRQLIIDRDPNVTGLDGEPKKRKKKLTPGSAEKRKARKTGELQPPMALPNEATSSGGGTPIAERKYQEPRFNDVVEAKESEDQPIQINLVNDDNDGHVQDPRVILLKDDDDQHVQDPRQAPQADVQAKPHQLKDPRVRDPRVRQADEAVVRNIEGQQEGGQEEPMRARVQRPEREAETIQDPRLLAGRRREMESRDQERGENQGGMQKGYDEMEEEYEDEKEELGYAEGLLRLLDSLPPLPETEQRPIVSKKIRKKIGKKLGEQNVDSLVFNYDDHNENAYARAAGQRRELEEQKRWMNSSSLKRNPYSESSTSSGIDPLRRAPGNHGGIRNGGVGMRIRGRPGPPGPRQASIRGMMGPNQIPRNRPPGMMQAERPPMGRGRGRGGMGMGMGRRGYGPGERGHGRGERGTWALWKGGSMSIQDGC